MAMLTRKTLSLSDGLYAYIYDQIIRMESVERAMNFVMLFFYVMMLTYCSTRAFRTWYQPERVRMVIVRKKPDRWLTFTLFIVGVVVFAVALVIRVIRILND